MYKFRIEFEVEPGNTQIDPEKLSVWIENGDNWEMFENVERVNLSAGADSDNQFHMKKLPESQRQFIKLAPESPEAK